MISNWNFHNAWDSVSNFYKESDFQVFFQKETDFGSQSRFVLLYPGETDYRCIFFAILERTIVTKNLFREETLN